MTKHVIKPVEKQAVAAAKDVVDHPVATAIAVVAPTAVLAAQAANAATGGALATDSEAAANDAVVFAAEHADQLEAGMEDIELAEQGLMFGCVTGVAAGIGEGVKGHWTDAGLAGGVGALSCVAAGIQIAAG